MPPASSSVCHADEQGLSFGKRSFCNQLRGRFTGGADRHLEGDMRVGSLAVVLISDYRYCRKDSW